jgi:CheY-like chemotaxis protein
MQHRIVLADDNHDTCYIIKKMLITAGYHVETLTEGKDILEPGFMVPDLFILDNFMPMIDGIALCKFLKVQGRTKNIPVILMSADHHIRSKAMKAGAQVFLEKPFQSTDLMENVKQLLATEKALCGQTNANGDQRMCGGYKKKKPQTTSGVFKD